MGEVPAAETLDMDNIRSRVNELIQIHACHSHISDSNPLDSQNLLQDFAHHLEVAPTSRSYTHFPLFSLKFIIICLLYTYIYFEVFFSFWFLNSEQSESVDIPLFWCGVTRGGRFGCVPFLFLFFFHKEQLRVAEAIFFHKSNTKMAAKVFAVVARFKNSKNWNP